MAEEGKKVVNIPELKKRQANWIKDRLNKLLLGRTHLGKLHSVDVEASTPVELGFKNEGIIDMFQGRMGLLGKVEDMWGELVSVREGLMKLYEIVGFLRYPEISSEESALAKKGTRIKIKKESRKETMRRRGMFEIEFQKFDERSKLLKKKGITEGLGKGGEFNSEIDGLKGDDYYYSEWVKFKVKVEGQEVEDYYPVPLAIPFKFWSSLLNDRDFLATEYLQGYFGFMNLSEVWEPEYKKFFDNIIEEAKLKIKCSNEKEEGILNENINLLKEAYSDAVSRIFSQHVYDRENEIFGKAKTISDKAAEIEGFRKELTQRTPQSLNIKIHFRHTYLIVDPSRIEWPVFEEDLSKVEGRTESEKRLRWKYGDYAEDMLRIRRYTKNKKKFEWSDFKGGGNSKKEGEKVPGLDENGWPLEVADDNYEWPIGSGNVFQKGAVLKDIFNFESPRIVPEEFIVKMDPLLMANCIHNEWDAVRDDLRDGRYHPKSLTIIDYIMAETPCQFNDLEGKKEWEPVSESLLEGGGEEGFRSYKMYYLDETLNPQPAQEGKRRPSNLIPAFDKRALKKPFIDPEGGMVHLGRKFYYQTARSILEIEEKDLREDIAKLAIGPHISTRGISHYIIAKIVSDAKYFGEAKKRLGIIATKHGVWYDYGPREMGKQGKEPLGPWD